MGIPVARIELVNALQMRAMIELFEARLSGDALPVRRVPWHRGRRGGTGGDLRRDRRRIWRRAVPLDQRRGGADEALEGAARRLLGVADAAARRQGLSTDVCVPISRLAECIAETEADIAEHGLIAPIVGHVGDGNFHVLVLMDVDDPKEIEATEAFVDRLNMRAIAMDGTCTGEHGIGQGKIAFMEQEHGAGVDSCARSSRRSTRSISSIRARYCRRADGVERSRPKVRPCERDLRRRASGQPCSFHSPGARCRPARRMQDGIEARLKGRPALQLDLGKILPSKAIFRA